MEDIIFITIAAVICGAETWNDIEDYGKSKKKWLEKYLRLPNGIPSHDTFNRFFSLLEPKVFEAAFLSWVRSVSSLAEGEVVSIDGKIIRGLRDSDSKYAVHMVSAWANVNRLSLGQVKGNQKSNEITAIPQLLDVLVLKGCFCYHRCDGLKYFPKNDYEGKFSSSLVCSMVMLLILATI